MCKLSLLGLFTASLALAQGDNQAPWIFHVRLETPLSSYTSLAGEEFTAAVIAPLEINRRIVIPQGSRVRGRVRRASAVGFGLVHERAMLELHFYEYELPGGDRYPLDAHLESLENAREQVDSRGRIKGVLAASSPQGLMRGIWFRPSANIFQRSALGLTGIGGTLWSRFSLGPAGAAGMLAARYIFFRLPEPEIQLPSGTEMRLQATNIPEDAPDSPLPVDEGVEEALAAWLRTHPSAVIKPDGSAAADRINMAFIGSAGELQNAFGAAGWVEAEPLTLRSFSEAYRAFFSMRGYPAAPVSTLLYKRMEPDIVFQKSLNTITKRHHIRIWRAGTFDGSEVWLGAATHDAGIGFQSASMTITHKIDPRTDLERLKVTRDLSYAGCAERISSVDRPGSVRLPGGKGILTDGDLAVIWLRPCLGTAMNNDPPAERPGSKSKRFARRFVLETRQYFLRDNMYYWAYRAVLWRHTNMTRARAAAIAAGLK